MECESEESVWGSDLRRRRPPREGNKKEKYNGCEQCVDSREEYSKLWDLGMMLGWVSDSRVSERSVVTEEVAMVAFYFLLWQGLHLSNKNLSGPLPDPSWRRPTPHIAAGYRPGCPQAVWRVGCTHHWTQGWRSQRLLASDKSPGVSGHLHHSFGYRRTRKSPST
jgi:hypothetical protein